MEEVCSPYRETPVKTEARLVATLLPVRCFVFVFVKITISCLCKTLCMLVLDFVFVESSVYGEVPCGIAR